MRYGASCILCTLHSVPLAHPIQVDSASLEAVVNELLGQNWRTELDYGVFFSVLRPTL